MKIQEETIAATLGLDGQLLLSNPPSLPAGPVQVPIRVAAAANGCEPGESREAMRTAALDQFLKLARASSFRSAGPYPSRDDLHERY